MASFRVLYWQEVPTQLEVEDDEQELKVMLPPKFMKRIDTLAAERGLTETESYLAQWHWSELHHRNGCAEDVAEAVQGELEAEIDW